MAKGCKGSPRPAAAATERRDMYVYNEATGFLITSGDMYGKQLDPDDSKWSEAVAAGDFIPIELYQDDPFIVRVLVEGELSKQEDAEWVGKFTHKLRIPDGKLTVAGGIELIMEPFEEGAESWISDYMAIAEVVPGDYQADIYTYINSVNSHPLLAMADRKNEPLGAYWRRSRKTGVFPRWLERWLLAYPDQDPGHEDEWKGRKDLPEEKPFVGLLIHLTPLPAKSPELPALQHGFYSWVNMVARKPTKCPAGLEANDVKGMPSAKPAVERPVQGVDVHKLVQHAQLAKLQEPVTVSLKDMLNAFTVAWYASSGAHPEVRVHHPGISAVYEKLPMAERSIGMVSNADTLVIQFEATQGRWDTLGRVRQTASNLHAIELPEDATVEIITAVPTGESQMVTRWRGVVRGGRWQLTETYPQLASGQVTEALRLAGEAHAAKRMSSLDVEAARQALRLFKAEWRTLLANSKFDLEGADMAIGGDADWTFANLLARNYFRLKFSPTWKADPIDPEVFEKADQLDKRAAALGNVIFEGVGGRKFFALGVDSLGAEAVEDARKIQADTEKLGGKFVGELGCSQFDKFVFRYFVMPDGHSRLAWYRGGLPKTMIEIITDFNDGASLSTSRQSGPGDDPAKKLYRLRIPGGDVEALYNEHVERCDTMAKQHGGCKKFDGTLVECARRFEEGIVRQS